MPPSARRSTPCGGAPVVEDVDGAAARGEGGGRNERREDRVLVVLAHGDDPHVHAVLPHQPGQDGLQPFREPGLLGRGLFAEGAERPLWAWGSAREATKSVAERARRVFLMA